LYRKINKKNPTNFVFKGVIIKNTPIFTMSLKMKVIY